MHICSIRLFDLKTGLLISNVKPGFCKLRLHCQLEMFLVSNISSDLFLANIHEDLDLLFAPSFPLEHLPEELNDARDASQYEKYSSLWSDTKNTKSLK